MSLSQEFITALKTKDLQKLDEIKSSLYSNGAKPTFDRAGWQEVVNEVLSETNGLKDSMDIWSGIMKNGEESCSYEEAAQAQFAKMSLDTLAILFELKERKILDLRCDLNAVDKEVINNLIQYAFVEPHEYEFVHKEVAQVVLSKFLSGDKTILSDALKGHSDEEISQYKSRIAKLMNKDSVSRDIVAKAIDDLKASVDAALTYGVMGVARSTHHEGYGSVGMMIANKIIEDSPLYALGLVDKVHSKTPTGKLNLNEKAFGNEINDQMIDMMAKGGLSKGVGRE